MQVRVVRIAAAHDAQLLAVVANQHELALLHLALELSCLVLGQIDHPPGRLLAAGAAERLGGRRRLAAHGVSVGRGSFGRAWAGRRRVARGSRSQDRIATAVVLGASFATLPALTDEPPG
jgi:hypothetical protein